MLRAEPEMKSWKQKIIVSQIIHQGNAYRVEADLIGIEGIQVSAKTSDMYLSLLKKAFKDFQLNLLVVHAMVGEEVEVDCRALYRYASERSGRRKVILFAWFLTLLIALNRKVRLKCSSKDSRN